MPADPTTISGGFATLPEAIDSGEAQKPILREQVRTVDEVWDDDVALGIVLSDISETVAYYQSKGLVPLGIENADDLVRAYVRPRQWPDGKSRANLSMHVTLQAIEKVLPVLYMALFGTGKKQPFLVDPVGKTTAAGARANASLLRWAMKMSKAKEEFRVAMKMALTYGFTVLSWGWESKTVRRAKYKADMQNPNKKAKRTWHEDDVEIPCLEACDLKMVGVDPTLKRQDVHQGASFVWKQSFTNGYGLKDFRNNPDYKNIPTDEELAEFLSSKSEPTTDEVAMDKRAVWREFQAQLKTEVNYKDPMMQPLEILEYTTNDGRVVSILQRKLTIRNGFNDCDRLNYQSCAFIDVLGSAWGFGIAKLLAGEQRLQQGVQNNYIDSLALILNPVFQLLKGIGPGTQSIPVSPGKVITESGELKPLVVPDITKPATEAIMASQMRADEKVAANGGSNMPNAAMRTAQGVNAFAGDVLTRLQYWLEIYINLIYLPTLEAFLEMMKAHLTPDQINSILTEEEGKAYEGDINEVYNAEVNVNVTAGADMMAKFAAAQLMPMILTLVTAGPVADQFEVQGKYFDFVEFTAEGLDLMGWDLDQLIKQMTPDMLQRVKDKNQAMQRAQGQIALENQKNQNTLGQIDAKASGQAGVAVIRSVLKNNEQAGVSALEGQDQSNGQ